MMPLRCRPTAGLVTSSATATSSESRTPRWMATRSFERRRCNPRLLRCILRVNTPFEPLHWLRASHGAFSFASSIPDSQPALGRRAPDLGDGSARRVGRQHVVVARQLGPETVGELILPRLHVESVED